MKSKRANVVISEGLPVPETDSEHAKKFFGRVGFILIGICVIVLTISLIYSQASARKLEKDLPKVTEFYAGIMAGSGHADITAVRKDLDREYGPIESIEILDLGANNVGSTVVKVSELRGKGTVNCELTLLDGKILKYRQIR